MKKRKRKCRDCNGVGKVSLASRTHAVMPMVTCPRCDGSGKEGGSLPSHISPDRLADGRDSL